MGFGFLQDDKGNSSWLRLIGVLVFCTLCLCYLILTVANIVVSCMGQPPRKIEMVEITTGVIAFAGLVLGAKEIQKAIENKGSPPQGG